MAAIWFMAVFFYNLLQYQQPFAINYWLIPRYIFAH